MTSFKNRSEAGRLLARPLVKYSDRSGVQVLALPRGGVPVGFEIAKVLCLPLDVFVVRKLGVPGHEELAMGAIATGGVRVLNDRVIGEFGISGKIIDAVAHQELLEIKRRERAYRADRGPLEVRGDTVILVDDGLATGSTMRAAIGALRQLGTARIVAAVPTAALSSAEGVAAMVDEFVAVITPADFNAVGQWYQDFSQTTDDEVRELLARAREFRPRPLG